MPLKTNIYCNKNETNHDIATSNIEFHVNKIFVCHSIHLILYLREVILHCIVEFDQTDVVLSVETVVTRLLSDSVEAFSETLN